MRSIYTCADGRTIQVRHHVLSSSLSISLFLSIKGSLTERRGIKYNVSFDLSASCVEHGLPSTSNVSRTMKLGRIDSVAHRDMSLPMREDENDDESSTISFHVSTKYAYTLTFSSTITMSRGETAGRTREPRQTAF